MIWKICSLSDVCSVFNGSTPSRKNKEYWENGSINWFTIEDIRKFGRIINKTTQYVTEKALKETGLKLIPINSVLLCCTASVGEYAITKIPLTMNQQFNALIPNKNELLPEFLFYYCSTIKKKLISASGTTTFDFISAGKLKKIKISYPPLPIQEKIVAKLDKIFAEIDKATAAAEANILYSHDLYSSSVTSFFKKLTDETVKLSSCSEIGYGYTSKSSIKFIGPKYLRITDIQNNRVNWSLVPNINKDLNKVKKFLLKEGDIVFARTGATTGKSYLVKNSPTSVFASYLIRVDANRDVVNPDYLRHFFQSKDYWNVINSGISGSAQGGFNASKLKKLKFPLPDKIKQVEIIKKLNEIEKFSLLYKNLQQKKIYQFNKLKQSILQQAFNGELVKAA